jgi:hypothetical protein
MRCTSAYADSQGKLRAGIRKLEEYAQLPETELADNAVLDRRVQFQPRKQGGGGCVRRHAREVPGALAARRTSRSLAFVQLNQIGQGIEQLRYVTSNYPGTDEARIAADRLQALGKP